MQKVTDIQKLARKNVLGLRPYASARDEFTADGREMVFLDANENPFDTGVNRYPDPQQRFLKTILARLKGVRPAQLLLGNGSDEVLDLIYRAFCEPGTDNVLTLPPTYGMYKVLADVNAVENREVLLTPDFEPDVEQVLKLADDHSKLLFLCSPNNPTGNSFSRGHIRTLLEGFQGLVVLDEAYIDFSEEESWLSELNAWPNLIVIQTLSKAYGMAGIRLGICYASEAIIALLNKIKPPYNVNALTQERAAQRIAAQQEVRKEVRLLVEERKKLERELVRIPCVEAVFPSDANFILARMDDAGKRYHQLQQLGIVVRNRSGQPRCENTLRLTVGRPEENEKLLHALKSL